MPIWSRRWPFFDYSIAAAPLDPGVFGLWKEGELIFVGATQQGGSLRRCLVEHFQGLHGNELRAADHYSWEVSENPPQRKREVLEQFRRERGRLPRLNPA